MFNKFISIIASVCLFFSCAAVNTAAAGIQVGNSKSSFNSELVIGLGIMDKQALSASEITKAQFTAMVCRLLGLKSDDNFQAGFFADVSTSISEAGYIKVAYDLGIIEGSGNNIFLPDKAVSKIEAAKMLVNALGYKLYAQAKGGWPAGYINASSQIGLLKGSVASDGFSGSDCAEILYNALNANLMVPNGADNYTTTNSNLLKDVFKVHKLKGMLTGNSQACLLGEENIDSGYITIDGVKYLEGFSNASGLLGCVVDFYYNFDNNDNRVLLTVKPVDGCDIINISPDDIVMGAETTIYKLNYNDFDGEQKEIKTNIKTATLNGSRIPYTTASLGISNGNIRFIDSEGSGVYDVVIINSYENFVVDTASLSKIIDKFGKPTIDINPNDSSNVVEIKRNGKKITADKLNQWDVLSVEQSVRNGKTYKNIIVSNNQISGTITEEQKNEDNTIKWMLIDDFPYKLDYSYNNALYSNQIYRVDIGDQNIFLLDYNNIIVGIKNKADSQEIYAYLMGVSRAKGIGGNYQIKVVDQRSNTVIYSLKSHIDFIGYDQSNNVVNSSISDLEAYNILNWFINSTTTKLIKIKVDSQGNVTSIKTDNPVGSNIEGGVNTYYKCATGSKLVYRPSSRSFKGYFSVSDDTKVFVVETKSSGTVVTISPGSYFKGDNKSYSVEAVDVDDLGVANVIIKYSDQGGGMVDAGTSFFILDKVKNAISDDGTNVIRLDGYFNFSKKSADIVDMDLYKVITNNGTNMLKRGDVLQLALNSENQVTDAVRLTIPPANKIINEGNVGEIAYGKILARSSARLMLETGLKATGVYWSGSGKVSRPYAPLKQAYYYDKNEDKIKIILPEEIEVGWYAFIRSTYDGVNEIVCFEQEQ